MVEEKVALEGGAPLPPPPGTREEVEEKVEGPEGDREREGEKGRENFSSREEGGTKDTVTEGGGKERGGVGRGKRRGGKEEEKGEKKEEGRVD